MLTWLVSQTYFPEKNRLNSHCILIEPFSSLFKVKKKILKAFHSLQWVHSIQLSLFVAKITITRYEWEVRKVSAIQRWGGLCFCCTDAAKVVFKWETEGRGLWISLYPGDRKIPKGFYISRVLVSPHPMSVCLFLLYHTQKKGAEV